MRTTIREQQNRKSLGATNLNRLRFRGKTFRSSLENLRACPDSIEGMNGKEVESMSVFPFMLSMVEAFLGFCRIILQGISMNFVVIPPRFQVRQLSPRTFD